MNLLKKIIPLALIIILLRNIFSSGYGLTLSKEYINIAPLLLAIPLVLLIYPEAAFAYRLILLKMGLDVKISKAIKLWIIANTSRYIPGTIWQYIGRVELFKKEAEVERASTIQALFIEILLILISSVTVSLLALPVLSYKYPWSRFLVILLPISISLFNPRISNYAINFINKIIKKVNYRMKTSLEYRDLVALLPAFILNFFINGVVIYLLINFLNPLGHPFLIVSISGMYAFSWLIGYLAVFSPGGLGVTEVSLAYLLSLLIPLSTASLVAILYRLLLTISELIVFIIALRVKS